MKKTYLLLFLTFLSISSFAQTPFGVSEKYGFNTQMFSRNGSILGLKAFKGKIYASMGTDSGYVFRSSTGDPGSYQKVFDQYGVTRSENFTVSNDGGGYMYMSTASTFSTNIVMRTADGAAWNNYFEAPSGVYNVSAFKSSGGAADSIYVSYYGMTGGIMIVKNSITANDADNSLGSWDTLADMNVQFGTSAYPTASIVFNDSLYYAFSDNSLYQTGNSKDLHTNTNFFNTMGAGSATGNSNCAAMEVYNGELYLGTTNNNSGFEIWKTSDGINFVSIIDSLFNSLTSVAEMKTAGGKLWILAKNITDNFSVYSYDGAVLTLEVSNEFGSQYINVNNYSAIELFNNHLYIGATHYKMPSLRLAYNGDDQVLATSNTTGGQIWRACMSGAFPTVDITNPNPAFMCEGNTTTLNLTGDALSYTWKNGATTSSINVADTGEYYVTGVGANGCRYSDFGSVRFFPSSQAPILTNGNNPTYLGSNYGLCSGDTTPVIIARDPVNDFNALDIPGSNSGFKTIANPDFDLNHNMTIELWIKANYGGATFVSEFDTLTVSGWPNNDFALITQDFSNNVYINLPGNGSGSPVYIGNLGPTFGQWNHIALRYNGADSSFTGFLNGVQGGSDFRTRELPEDFGGYDAYKVGMDAFAPSYLGNFSGRVRDIRIWNSVRTPAEITSNMYSLPAGSYPSLVYYYKTLETSGTVAFDSSGNGFNAYVNGSGAFVTPQIMSWSSAPTLTHVGADGAMMFPSTPTTYTAYYTDVNSCQTKRELTVEPLYIQIQDVYNSNFASCGGSAVYVQPYTNGTLNNPTWTTVSMGSVATYSTAVSPASNEYLYLTDVVNGGTCSLVDSVLIKVGPAFTPVIGNPIPIQYCEGTVVTLDATAQGGTLPYTFYWNQPSLGEIDTTNVDTFLYTIPTPYNEVNLMATDAIGCSFSMTFSSNSFTSTDLFGHVSTAAPVSIDNGFIYVFKHQPGNAGFDTVGYTSLDANGDYLFSPLTAGDYLIKALPDESDFPLAVPTYYGNAFQWDSSLVYVHGCTQSDTANIVVVESTANITGPGSISGYITEGYGFGVSRLLGPDNQPNNPFAPGGPLKGVDVKLGKNPGGGIQARTASDTISGFYMFDSLPVGEYIIYVDIPNLPMDSTRHVIIAGADSSIQNNYIADSASVFVDTDTISPVGIYSSAKQYENKFSIYPNPAKGAMYVSYELNESSTVAFEIVNTMGQLMRSEPGRKYPEGNNIFIFNTEQLNLQGGVYFISIITNGKKYTQRIVVID